MSELETLAINYARASQNLTRTIEKMDFATNATEKDKRELSVRYRTATEEMNLAYNHLINYVNTFHPTEKEFRP